jgi:hypothetical protein
MNYFRQSLAHLYPKYQQFNIDLFFEFPKPRSIFPTINVNCINFTKVDVLAIPLII